MNETKPKKEYTADGKVFTKAYDCIAYLLSRPHGITTKEALGILGWPTISMQTVARRTNIKLDVKMEKGRGTYFGRPMTPEEILAKPHERAHKERVPRTGVYTSPDNRKWKVPEGLVVTDIVRKGMALEAEGRTSTDVVRELHVHHSRYTRSKMIVMLGDHKGLNESDAATVQKAIQELNETRLDLRPYNLIADIAKKVWGVNKNKNTKTAAKIVEDFQRAVSSVFYAASRVGELEVPVLSAEILQASIEEIEESLKCLTTLRKRLKEEKGK